MVVLHHLPQAPAPAITEQMNHLIDGSVAFGQTNNTKPFLPSEKQHTALPRQSKATQTLDSHSRKQNVSDRGS